MVSPWPGEELVAAYLGAGSIQEQPESYHQLPIVNGMIKIPDGHGTRQVLLAYARRTGQNVKRAAVGSEGPVLDHYSAPAVEAHLRWAGDRMLDAVPAQLVGSVFCDSLEVYEADWTPALPDEFARRRGYPLIPVLYRLAVDGPNAVQVRADYHRTLVELYQENFVAVVQRWAASRGVRFRIQGYGTPPATISSYRFADMFEGEGWGWKEITQTRWASSAGHLYGRDVVSAEIWTWVHSPSFRATPLDLKGEAHEHLLNGINQLIGHGWPYSPADAPGLGWFFYAAGAIDDRNPWWPAMPRLNAYLSRLCWLLRQGEPVADVAVYVPNEDLFAVMGRAVGGSLDTWREASRRIAAEIPATIRLAGLDYDLIDDEALAIIPPDRYRVVIIPSHDHDRGRDRDVAGQGDRSRRLRDHDQLDRAGARCGDCRGRRAGRSRSPRPSILTSRYPPGQQISASYIAAPPAPTSTCWPTPGHSTAGSGSRHAGTPVAMRNGMPPRAWWYALERPTTGSTWHYIPIKQP